MLEQFQTDTADYADILLPVTTFLEHTDLYLAYGHYYMQLARPALPAPGETKPNVEIFRLLARAMGFDGPVLRGFRRRHDPAGARVRPSVPRRHHAGAARREHSVRLNIPAPFLPFADGEFPTPTGRVDLGLPVIWSTRRRSNPASATDAGRASIPWRWFRPRTTTA